MITGTYDSTNGIYEFNGKYYKPRWYANSLREPDVLKIYNTCIAGLNDAQWPRTIFVAYQNSWEKIQAHYPGLYAQSQLHYYYNAAMGHVPDWAIPWQQSGYLLMHEYEAGKIAWMRPEDKFENDIYIFFVDSSKPEDLPEDETETGGEIPGGVLEGFILPTRYNIMGKFNIFTGKFTGTIESEE
jgi:hypothetical protein